MIRARIARIPHQCAVCSRWILKGEVYVYESKLVGASCAPFTNRVSKKTCAKCWNEANGNREPHEKKCSGGS